MARLSWDFNGSTVTDGASVTAYLSANVPATPSCAPQTRTGNNGILTGSYGFNKVLVFRIVVNAPQQEMFHCHGARAIFRIRRSCCHQVEMISLLALRLKLVELDRDLDW